MTYVIVTGKDTVVGMPTRSYVSALNQANRLYGKNVNVEAWIINNVRIEESR